MTKKFEVNTCELIIGNSNSRFSGVTSTMLQTLTHQQHIMNVRVLGKHHLADPSLCITFWQAIKAFRKPLANGKFRIFHARRNDEMIQALILKHIFSAKIKIVFTSTAQRYHTAFTRKLMRNMDAIISTCQAAASYLQQAPDIIIAHGVQTHIYVPPKNKAAQWQKQNLPGTYGIGIFGRVRKQKGVHLFVQACIEVFHEFPDYTGIIVGATYSKDKEFVDALKEKIKQSKLEKRIVFLGEKPFEEIPQLFQSVSLVAALSNNEGFGLTVLEAMSSGVAVIATNAGAWREIVRENIDGNIIKTDDLTALVETLRETLSDPEQLTAMGKNGRQHVLQHYCVKREAKELCDFFKILQSQKN